MQDEKVKAYIFNSKKEYWNWATRQFQSEPIMLDDSMVNIEFPMAIKSDDTCDIVRFCIDDGTERIARNRIRDINMTELHLSVLREMNKMVLNKQMERKLTW